MQKVSFSLGILFLFITSLCLAQNPKSTPGIRLSTLPPQQVKHPVSTLASRNVTENLRAGQVTGRISFVRGGDSKLVYKVTSSGKHEEAAGEKICTVENVSVSGGGSEFSLMSPISTIMPGMILDSKSVITGEFKEISLPRGTLEINSDIIAGGAQKSAITIKGDISKTVLFDNVKQILAKAGNVNLGFTESLKFEQIDSYEQLQIKANASYSGWGQNVKASLGFSNESTKNRLVAYYVSKAFDIVVSGQNGGFQNVLAPNTAVPEGAVIVSRVSFGKIISVVAETDLSKEDLELAVQYSGNFGAYGTATADFDMRKKSMLNSTKISAFVYGANGSITSVIGTGLDGINKVKSYIISEGNKWDIQNNAVKPIAYQLNFLDDGSVATLSSTLNFPRRTCVQNVFNFDIKFLGFACASKTGKYEGAEVNLFGSLTFHANNVLGECVEVKFAPGAGMSMNKISNQLCPTVYNLGDKAPYTFMKIASCSGRPQSLDSHWGTDYCELGLRNQILSCSNQPSDVVSVKTTINTPADQIVFSVNGQLKRQMGMDGWDYKNYDSGSFYLKDILAASDPDKGKGRLVLKGLNVHNEVIVYPVFEVKISN